MLPVFGQNLLKDVYVQRVYDATYGFNSNVTNCKLSFCNLSKLRYGCQFDESKELFSYYFDFEFFYRYHEYLQVPLTQPLMKDSTYILDFLINPFFSRKRYSRSRKMKISFLTDTFNKNIVLKEYPYHQIPLTEEEAKNWVDKNLVDKPMSYQFVATGEEKALFILAESSKKVDVMFRISELCLHKENTSCLVVSNHENDKIDSIQEKAISATYVDFFYDSDSDELSEAQKNKLGIILNETKGLKSISCVGFADSTGQLKYNQNLSLRRASNISKYIKVKFPEMPIITEGKGVSYYKIDWKNRFVRVYFNLE